jgi:hypothetical protein
MNWPLPELNEDCLQFNQVTFVDNLIEDEYTLAVNRTLTEDRRNNKDEWDIEWPNLAPVDISFPWNDCSDIDLWNAANNIDDQIRNGNVLAYYVPYAYLVKTFQRKEKKQGNHDEILAYNQTLPQYARFGIHLCHENILSFRNHVVAGNNNPDFKEYTLALLIKFLLGHEWGHYRAEINLIQQNLYLYAVRNQLEIKHNSYYLFSTGRYRDSDFEEVFADFCGLKYGLFNLKFNDLSSHLGRSSRVKSLEDSLAHCIFKNNNSPYGDVRYWINGQIDINKSISAYFNKPRFANRLIQIGQIGLHKDNTYLKTQLLDVLTHNQNQFINGKSPKIFGSKSAKLDPEELNTSWHHVSRDPIQSTPNLNNKDNFIIDCDGIKSPLTAVIKAIGKPNKNNSELVRIPLLSVPELLRVGPIMIEQY